jgi:DNA-binding CsgD family transcriptional regulator
MEPPIALLRSQRIETVSEPRFPARARTRARGFCAAATDQAAIDELAGRQALLRALHEALVPAGLTSRATRASRAGEMDAGSLSPPSAGSCGPAPAVLLDALRRHLATGWSVAFADLDLQTLARMAARVGFAVTRTTVLGARLAPVDAAPLSARWERQLAAEHMRAEPAPIRRGAIDIDPETAILPAGAAYKSASGVHKQAPPEGATASVVADTKNPDGSRGRTRRHIEYHFRLMKASRTGRLTRRERQLVDQLLAGARQTEIAQQLGVHGRTCQRMLARLHAKLGVPGPGPGR